MVRWPVGLQIMPGEPYAAFSESLNFALHCTFLSLSSLAILSFLNFKYDRRVSCCGESNSCGRLASNAFVKSSVVFCVSDPSLRSSVVCF